MDRAGYGVGVNITCGDGLVGGFGSTLSLVFLRWMDNGLMNARERYRGDESDGMGDEIGVIIKDWDWMMCREKLTLF